MSDSRSRFVRSGNRQSSDGNSTAGASLEAPGPVIPAQAVIQSVPLDSRLYGNDDIDGALLSQISRRLLDREYRTELFVRIVAISLAAVLFWSSVEHLKNPFAFLTNVLRYRLVSGDVAAVVAMALPVVQAVLAGMLVFGAGLRTALLGTALLLSGFSAVQTSALVRDLKIACGCFGAGNETPITWSSISAVTGMACVAGIAAITSRRGSSAGMSVSVAGVSRYAFPPDPVDRTQGAAS
jgi:hypothetical protein